MPSTEGRVGFGYAAWAHTWLAEALLGLRDFEAAGAEADEALASEWRAGAPGPVCDPC